MKSPTDITKKIESRLRGSWHLDVTGRSDSFPTDIPIGSPERVALDANFSAVQRQVRELRDWAARSGLAVREGNRRVAGTTQPIPTHVTVPNLDTAAAVCGGEWVARIARGRDRAAALGASIYGERDCIPAVVRAVDTYGDLDFSLLLTVADWFETNDAHGLTPRQVPIPGVHAKWLNSGQPIVELLTGRPLDLAPRHPARIHYVYLDPEHLASGGRRFDSATVDDTAMPAYRPDVVVITENKDTAIHFPELRGGVAVEGDGTGGSTVASFDWIIGAPVVVYWGDIDADGFEILDGYRRDGVPAMSILMDVPTYRAYAEWGTRFYPNGNEIGPREPKPLSTVTDGERDAYLAVCNPAPGLPPRIEQERIPLDVARRAVLDAVAEAGASASTRRAT